MSPQYSRVRVRGGNYIHPGYNLWSGNGFVTGPDPVTTFDYIETFKDSVHSYAKGTRRYPVGDGFHEIFSANLSDLVPFVSGAYTNSPQHMRPMIAVQNISDFVPDIPNSLRSQLNEEAFISFSTQFPEEISLSEFILGLRQIGDLLPRLEKSVHQTVGGAYLTKKFGWDNLLSDLRSLYSIVSTLKHRIDFLRKTRGKPTRIGYYRGDCYQPVYPDDAFFEQYSGWGTRLRLESYRSDYRATATLFHLLNHLDDLYGLLRSGISAFGLANPLKAIWVNLPFSFVVDWFLKISTHLDRLATIKPAELWDISNISHSFRTRCTVAVFQDNHTSYTGNPLVRLGVVTVDQFDRRVGLPIELDVYTPANLSPSQLTLFLAMLASSSR